MSLTATRAVGDGANAGVGTMTGAGGLAPSASFGQCYLACDAAGNLYCSDAVALICAVNMQGTTQTLLGVTISAGCIDIVGGTNGGGGTGLDGGPAVGAAIQPGYITCDAAGNLYVSDQTNASGVWNNLVRKIDHTTGIITTVVGGGVSSAPCPATSFGFSTSLDMLGCVTIGPDGNLYFVISQYNHGGNANASRIYVVNMQGTTQTILGVSVLSGDVAQVAGTGTPGFSGDGGSAISAELFFVWTLRFDSVGNLYLGMGETLAGCNRVRRIDHATGIITTVVDNTGTIGYTGDGGSATAATISRPTDLLFLSDTDYYISDIDNFVIREVTSGIINTLVITSTDPVWIANSGLSEPQALAKDSAGNVYLQDGSGTPIVYKLTPSIIPPVIGCGGVTQAVGNPLLPTSAI